MIKNKSVKKLSQLIKNSAYIFVGILFFYSCKNDIKKNVASLSKCENIKAFKIPNIISPTTLVIREFNVENVDYIAIKNGKENEVCIFNFETETFEKLVKFNSTGPNGIGKLQGFEIINFDSILLTSNNFFNKLYLTDTTSIIRNIINFDSLLSKSLFHGIAQLMSNVNSNVYYANNKLLIGTMVGEFYGNKNDIQKCNLVLEYDFKKNKAKSLSIFYPKLSYEKIDLLHPTVCFGKDKFILSFAMFDNIFVSNNKDILEEKFGKSSFRNKDFKLKKGSEFEEYMVDAAKSPIYLGIVYDKFRKVYYRFAYPGVDVKHDDNVRQINEFRKVFSIMIFDNDLNYIGETKLPENCYNSNMFFINKEGLWLSLNHINNVEFDHDYLKFQLFKLKKEK